MDHFPKPAGLYEVGDFGLTLEEIAELEARQPLTDAEIGAAIVDEEVLARLGRWAGGPAPRREAPWRLAWETGHA